ncbi:MAG TPA: GNAT family N-acetyltransferase [Vicinamibacterales bacterium]|nr:GNAT family N-acetyltransferase [Vicinamibacterales bacterium]
MPKPPELEPEQAEEPDGSDWREDLPLLTGRLASLREIRPTDAPTLVSLLTTPEVSRFLSQPPTTVTEFQRFVEWAMAERETGRYICYVVVPHESQQPVGLIHVRELEPRFATAEWGFAFGSRFWGSGYFMDAARQVIDFAFGTLGVHRLEARAALQNGRCNNALQKIGAVKEAVLRRAFQRGDEYLDQALWTIVDDDWLKARSAWTIHVH